MTKKTKPISRGFALFEFCVVIGILAIVATLTMQSFSWYRRLFVHTELDRLYTLCLATSRQAIINNTNVTINFDSHKNNYKLVQGKTTQSYQLADGIIFGLLPGVQGPPANPTKTVRHPITFERQRITLYADGKIQAGTLYITDSKKKWQYALSSPVGTVPYLRRYRYENNRWTLL